MNDHAYQKTAILTCPECGEKLFLPLLIADGQAEKRTCPNCGLVITVERPALTTNQRPGPQETK